MTVNMDFKGIWIPKEIWLNDNLSVMEKLFLVEIDSLDNEKGCFASNKYFSEFFKITKGRSTQIIKSLESKGLVTISYRYEGKEIKERIIKVVNKLSTPVNKLNQGSKFIKSGYLENADDSNTSTSNTNNNNTVLKYGDFFNEWWKLYPNKKGKEAAQKKFEKLLEEDKVKFEDLINGVEKYKLEVDQKNTPKQYIKHPTTWLNQGCWLDDYDIQEIEEVDKRYDNLPI